ncbi:MAG: HEAT repeat domain-containing protein [Methanotrichaceae archaeon]|nr:HEAT repeat domain-containing protein [Methanotrichaceae archaeon]
MALCLPALAQIPENGGSSSSTAADGWQSRLKAIDSAGALGQSEAVAVLIDALKDRNSSIRARAVEALGRYNNTRSRDALIQSLGDGSPRVSDQAKLSLVKIGSSVVLPLIAALRHDNTTLRANAAQVLGRLHDARAVGPLRQLQMESNNSEVQTKTAYALRKLDWKREGTS